MRIDCECLKNMERVWFSLKGLEKPSDCLKQGNVCVCVCMPTFICIDIEVDMHIDVFAVRCVTDFQNQEIVKI